MWSQFLQNESEKSKIQRMKAELSEIVLDSLQRIPNERGELSREHAVSVVNASAGKRNLNIKQQDVEQRVGLELQNLVNQGILCPHKSNSDVYYIAN